MLDLCPDTATAFPATADRVLPQHLRLGDIAPDFEAMTTHGRVRLHRWIGNRWSLLIPQIANDALDAATDHRRAAELLPDFRARAIQLLGLVLDGPVTLGDPAAAFPLAGDADGAIARLYGLAAAEARTIYAIDPARCIRLVLSYPPRCRRDFALVLDHVGALQRADAHRRSAAQNWQALQQATFGWW